MNNGQTVNLKEIFRTVPEEGLWHLESKSLTYDKVADLWHKLVNNQDIVEHIMNCSNCGCIGWSNCKYFRQNLDDRKTVQTEGST